jgi:N-acetylmuramoyl-L-alanine amidase
MLALLKGDDTKVKKAILKGIYEDNLSLSGKRSGSKKRNRMSGIMKCGAALVSLFVFFVLGGLDSSDTANVRGVSVNPAISNPKLHDDPRSHIPAIDTGLYVSGDDALFVNAATPAWDVFGFRVKTIIIDPGHGGEDPGAVGAMGTQEKDITLDVSGRLRDRLAKYGNYRILMTREHDVTVPLKDRIEFANSHNADLYISVHVNSVPKKRINIIETYYFGTNADEETLRLAERENEGSEYALHAYRNVIQKICNTMKFQESKELAASIQRSLYGNMSRRDKSVLDYGIKTAPFVVLLGVDVPSVLVETSCLSHEGEEKKLNSWRYREDIATYLEKGIVMYLNNKSNKGEVSYAARSVER